MNDPKEEAEALIEKRIKCKPVTGPYRNKTANECALEDCKAVLEGIEEYKKHWLQVKQHLSK